MSMRKVVTPRGDSNVRCDLSARAAGGLAVKECHVCWAPAGRAAGMTARARLRVKNWSYLCAAGCSTTSNLQ